MEIFSRINFSFWILFLSLLLINANNFQYENISSNTTSRDIQQNMKRYTKNKSKSIYNKRKLQTSPDDDFFPLNIFIDLFNFNYTYPNETLLPYKEDIIKAIYNTKHLLEKFIKIGADITANIKKYEDTNRGEWGLDFWDIDMFENKMNLSSYNYYILFRFDTKIKTVASSVIVDSYFAPTIGVVTINNETILDKSLTPKYFNNLMMQQFIHLLGFHIDNEAFSNNIIEEDENFYITEDSSETLFEYAKKYFGCDTIDTIYFDKDEEGNIFWPARQFLGEIMTNFDYPEEKVLSEFTLRYLEDLGYYKIDHKYTGGLMRFGKKKGCKFFKGNCGRNLEEDEIDSGKKGVNDNKLIFANEFYLPVIYSSFPQPSCSSGRLSKTIYKLHEITSDYADKEYEYVLVNSYVGSSQTNYCPIAEFSTDPSINLYTGSCFDDETQTDDLLKEEKGNNSFCILRSLENIEEIRAACYKMFCSSDSLTILINSIYIVCPRSGGKIYPDKSNYYILCPDYYLICSGYKLCNSMIDCIVNESEEKPSSLEYNYEIKTTQNYSNFKNDPNITEEAWELSQDETKTCPYLCMQCDINKKCIKCRPNYKVYNEQENECLEIVPNCKDYDEKDKCTGCNEGYSLALEYNGTYVCIDNDKINTENFYFKEAGKEYYERCNYSITNCLRCSSQDACITCMGELEVIDDGESCGDKTSKRFYKDISDSDKYKSCNKYIGFPNCDECEYNGVSNFKCLKCMTGYVFVHDDENTVSCLEESSLTGNIYYKENENNYYKCEIYNQVEKCFTCNTKDKCLTCQTGYQTENGNSLCLSSNDISNKLYYKDTNNYYYLCSLFLTHCNKCENKNQCIECDSSDYLLDNMGKCFSKTLYDEHYYYKIGDTNIYGSCSTIQNCEKCNSVIDCISCKTNHYFVLGDDDKLTCQEIDLDCYYENNQGDKKYYTKCDKAIENCDKCSNSTYCTRCSSNFAIIEDDHTKCEDLSTEKYYKEISSGKYRLCSNKLSKCEKCTLEESSFHCQQCETSYSLSHDNDIKCIEKETMKDNKLFFTNDSEINYYSCNKYNDVAHCQECSSKETCSKCKTSYRLVNENTACFLEEDIENSLVYHDQALDLYILCSDLIQDCKKCSDRTICFLCEDGSVVEENNTCISKEFVQNNSYVEDETTHKYVSCSIIDNCITCTSTTVCTKCIEGFNVENNICQIITSTNNSSDKKLSTGAITGIVFGCLGFLLIVAGVVYFLLSGFKKNIGNNAEINLAVNEENVNNFNVNDKIDIENHDIGTTKKRSIHNA